MPKLRPERFLADLLYAQLQLDTRIDTKAKFLLSIAGIIFVLTMVHVLLKGVMLKAIAGILVLDIACIITVILCIYVIRPGVVPFKDRAVYVYGNPFFYGSIVQHRDFKDFCKTLERVLKDGKILEIYAREIYELATRSIAIKLARLKLAADSLIIGLILGFLLIALLAFV
jgi:hypothetical protein